VDWVDAVVQGILLGGFYALFAAGLSLVFGVMRIVNLAHGDFSILAAFLAVVAIDELGTGAFLALVLVVPVMFALGYAVQYLVINASLKGGELQPLLATFGIAIVLQNVLQEAFSADSRGLNAGSIETSSIQVVDQITVGWFPLLTLAVSVFLLLSLQILISRTQLGRIFRATSDDREAAQLLGVDNRRVYAMAMGIALVTCAIAGIFLGIRTTFTPTAGPLRLIFAFEAVIIGGIGSLWGTLVGGIVLGVAQSVGAQASPGWGILTGHLVTLAVLVFRPYGLFPRLRSA
jgi:branched-chain amino acid transport system permease protein